MTDSREGEPALPHGRDPFVRNEPPCGAQRLERVRMIRPTLVDLAECPLPPGFSLRDYRSGDRIHWQRIITATELHLSITADHHLRAFGPDETEIARRQLFLTGPDGREVGTATAWFGTEPFSIEWGRIHWLAILPAWQGRGLGKALLAAALRRLRKLGHQRAYLVTEIVRLPAIRLYLQAGFAPDIRNPAEATTWRSVSEA